MPQKSILQLKKTRTKSLLYSNYAAIQRSNYDLVEDNFILIIE